MAQENKRTEPIFTQWGDPIMHKPTKSFPRDKIGKPAFKKLIKMMFGDMENAGVGLAANQIGLPLKLAVIEVKIYAPELDLNPVPPTVIINPQIIDYSKNKVGGWEGCLSCRGVRFWVERSSSIEVRYIDENNKIIKRIIGGWEAVVFQHEIDHLNGIVCGERVAIRDKKVMSGAIISEEWYNEHFNSIPSYSSKPKTKKRK